MGDISVRLNRRDFKCRCGRCEFQAVDAELLTDLEDLADEFQTKHLASKCIINIESGCRCIDHNEAIQSKRNKRYKPLTSKSYHLYGMAVDVWFELFDHREKSWKVDPGEVAAAAEKRWPASHGIGRNPTYTHIDVGPKRRW